MRSIEEIEINGGKLSDILAEHNLWLADPVNHKKANLSWANLSGADLSWANLSGADLDYSCWPLWCGSKGVKIDRKQFAQLAAHLCVVDVDDDECKDIQQYLIGIAKTSHRANDLGL